MIELGSPDLNHAHIGNILMSRPEGVPVPEWREHVRETAAEIGADVLVWGLHEIFWVDDVQTIDIEGGLKEDASSDFATVGDEIIHREDNELIENFRSRARARAFAFGSPVVFGGLPPVKYEDEPT
jgi:hypothetical protein